MSFADLLEFKGLHKQTYVSFGYLIIDVPAAALSLGGSIELARTVLQN